MCGRRDRGKLADTFWPGPLTLVLPRRPDCPVALLAGAGLETLAVRVPAHPVALRLLRPSGGRSRLPRPTDPAGSARPAAQHVLDGLEGRIAAMLDSGTSQVGVEFTVLDLTGDPPVLLRPGGVTEEDLTAQIGPIRRGLPHTGCARPA